DPGAYEVVELRNRRPAGAERGLAIRRVAPALTKNLAPDAINTLRHKVRQVRSQSASLGCLAILRTPFREPSTHLGPEMTRGHLPSPLLTVLTKRRPVARNPDSRPPSAKLLHPV